MIAHCLPFSLRSGGSLAYLTSVFPACRAPTTGSLLDLDLFSRGIAVISCASARSERTCRAKAVLEKLKVSNLVRFETCQQAERRSDFPSGHVRFESDRAKEGDSVPLLDGIRELEIERLPESLDCPRGFRQRLRTLMRACPGHDLLQLRVVEGQ